MIPLTLIIFAVSLLLIITDKIFILNNIKIISNHVLYDAINGGLYFCCAFSLMNSFFNNSNSWIALILSSIFGFIVVIYYVFTNILKPENKTNNIDNTIVSFIGQTGKIKYQYNSEENSYIGILNINNSPILIYSHENLQEDDNFIIKDLVNEQFFVEKLEL